MEEAQLLEVARVDEIPLGKMRHVEVQGKEIVISNVGGKFYAMDDRCGRKIALITFQMGLNILSNITRVYCHCI